MKNMLNWESAGTDEPRDQNADSLAGGAHSYWSLGPSHELSWSAELIVRNCDLEEIPDAGLSLSGFISEKDAKQAAQDAEDEPSDFDSYTCAHERM